MKDIYDNIEKYFQFEKTDSTFISLFKSVLLIVSGAYFGLFIKEINATEPEYQWEHLIFSTLGISICLFIEFRKLKKGKKFSCYDFAAFTSNFGITKSARALQS